MPEIGDNVHVWPHPGRNVRSHAELNRMLPPEGMKLPWSAWLEEQHGQGLVHLTDPKAPIDQAEAKKRIAAARAEESKAADAEEVATPSRTVLEPLPAELPVPAPAPTSNSEGK
jgi:hypothetical protein